ncbi:MAG: hypothetical protein QNJ34_25635 [Xenococcaceae cyanobacterium MO_188.B29]|nr:hypothetical protein [Xenococcaceae cyanobacterium MO_188.B29]
MSTQEEARKVMAKSRQHSENRQQNMLSRAESDIEQSSQSKIEVESRKLIVKQRKHDRHLRNSLLSRSEAEVNHNA